jgi:geranylgeranyl reductase family protein
VAIVYDIVILGAGPAGSAAARTARALGHSVAIIDRAVFPRNKLCGALVSGRAHKAMTRVFGLAPGPERFLISREVIFKWDGEELCRFEAPYDLTYTYRRDFDHWLLAEAIAAGTRDYQGCRVALMDEAASRLKLSDGREIEYRVLIGADGAASPVAKRIFGRAFDPDKIGFAFEAEVAPGCPDGAAMSIDFAVVRWGYGWNFPKKESRTIGLGALQSVEQDLKERMRLFLEREGADPEAQKVKGAFIPLGDYRKVPGRGNILLVGDAAGLVDSMTGEGIAYALESGAEAAVAAGEALAAGKPGQAIDRYLKRVKYIHGELDKSNRLRQIAFSSAMRDRFRGKLETSETMRRTFFELLEGNITYADVEKKVAKQTLKRLGRGFTGWPKALAGRLKG